MDNSVLPYSADTDSSDESDSSDSSNEGNLLTNNLGVYNDKFTLKEERFMNQEKVEDYLTERNKLFTPELVRKTISVKLKSSDGNSVLFKLNENGLSTRNIIGFKIVRSSLNTNTASDMFVDILIPEIPDIACDINERYENIIGRSPVSNANPVYYNYQYNEKNIKNNYFYPISISQLMISVIPNNDSDTIPSGSSIKGFLNFEFTYLNDKSMELSKSVNILS